MKIVIDIDEEFYTVCKEWVADYCANIEQAIIAEGTPLPQGEWIFQYRFLDEDLYKCSNCGRLISVYDNGALSDYKFCQECGAKMKGDNKNG